MYAGEDKPKSGSLILSAEMMFRPLGWVEEANRVVKSLVSAIGDRQLTSEFARFLEAPPGFLGRVLAMR